MNQVFSLGRGAAVFSWIALASGSFANPPDNIIPKTLSLRVEHPPRIFYSVNLVNGQLRYTRYWDDAKVPEKSIKTVPTKEQWQKFRADLEKLKIWEWRARYEPAKEADKVDTIWSTVVKYADKQIRSDGINSYPGPNNKKFDSTDKESDVFVGYLLAMRDLIGNQSAFSASESRALAKGYFLTAVDDAPDTIFLCHPGVSAAGTGTCGSITQIGWREPYIVTNEEVINTSSGFVETLRIDSPSVNPEVRTITTRPATEAWKLLDETKTLW